MTDETENNNSDETEGKGKTGRGGKSGSTSGGGIRLPPSMLKEVMSNWEHLDVTKVAARMAEFFSELPARASAHVQVSWANIQNKGYTIVTDLLKFAQEIQRLMQNLTRENKETLRQKYGLNVTGPSG